MHTFRDLSTRKRNLVQSSHLIFPQKTVPFLSLIWFRFSDDHARRRCSDDCKGPMQLPYYPMLSVFEINGSFISFDCAACAAGPQRQPGQGPVSTKSDAHGGLPMCAQSGVPENAVPGKRARQSADLSLGCAPVSVYYQNPLQKLAVSGIK